MDSLDETLKGVFTVLRIAREGSFRGAMRSGGTGFRKLQQQVQALEAELGVLIFHRTPDGVVQTTEGKIIIEHAQQIEDILQKMLRLGQTLNQQQDGEVMLAATEGLGTFWMSPRLSEFNKLHPGISIRLHPSMSLADMRRFEIWRCRSSSRYFRR
jgi:DNA-binding transcriptional LysR family regulator